MEIILNHGSKPLTLDEARKLQEQMKEIQPSITFFTYSREVRQFLTDIENTKKTGYPVILFATALQDHFCGYYTLVIAASGIPSKFKKLFPEYSIKEYSK